MKKTLILGLAIGFAFTATSAMATIVGSDHDMNTGMGNDAQQRICVYCHHPHNSIKAGSGTGVNVISYSPLWNREYRADRDNDGLSDFTAYDNGVNMSNTTDKLSSTSKHLMNGVPAVGGVSLLCLSCHDGVTAINAYSSNNSSGTSTGSVLPFNTPAPDTTNGIITGVAALGLDLSNHHPIGMSWDAVTADDDEIAQKTDTFKDTTITIGSVLTGGDTMECSSCHDVHNTNVAGRNNAERFLWTSNDSSHFCLSCHLK